MTQEHLYKPPAPPRLSEDDVGDPQSLEGNLLRFFPEKYYHADVLELPGSLTPQFLINDPDLFNIVLNDKVEHFHKGDGLVELLRPLLGKHPVVTKDHSCADQRMMIKPISSWESQQAAFIHIQQALDGFEQICLEEGAFHRPVNLYHLLRNLTTDIAFRTVFSHPLSHTRYREYHKQVNRFDKHTSEMVRRNAMMAAAWHPDEHHPDALEAAQKARAIVGQQVEYFRETNDYRRRDIFHTFLSARSPITNKRFSRDQVVDHVMAVANSQQIVASVLTWTFYVLYNCKHYAQMIREEVASTVGPHRIRYENITRLRLSRNVLREVMRLYPPIPLLSRVAANDVQVKYLNIPKGSEITISPWVVHRHSHYWDHPDFFDPDRFVGEDPKKTLKYFVPFGRGPRMCLGASLASIQGTLILARLLKKYDFEIANTERIEPIGSLIIEPSEPIMCKLVPRSVS